jgi:hypothetical protein
LVTRPVRRGGEPARKPAIRPFSIGHHVEPLFLLVAVLRCVNRVALLLLRHFVGSVVATDLISGHGRDLAARACRKSGKFGSYVCHNNRSPRPEIARERCSRL